MKIESANALSLLDLRLDSKKLFRERSNATTPQYKPQRNLRQLLPKLSATEAFQRRNVLREERGPLGAHSTRVCHRYFTFSVASNQHCKNTIDARAGAATLDEEKTFWTCKRDK